MMIDHLISMRTRTVRVESKYVPLFVSVRGSRANGQDQFLSGLGAAIGLAGECASGHFFLESGYMQEITQRCIRLVDRL